jgi:arylsulfatase A-like enzyme
MREATDRPNIILINCDDLGYGDLGCYGSTVHRTPALDKLAARGVRMTEFYMASPVCSPSRGAMLTGCYPGRVGFDTFEGRWVLFPGQPVGLSTDETTIAGMLKGAGYATKLVGKWHCGDQPEFLPTRHGFDSYYGLPYSNDMGRIFADSKNPPLPLMRDEEVIQAQPDQANLIERYTEESVRFLREHRDVPFFLYLAHMQVHLPLYAPKRFVDGSNNGRYGACVEAVDWSTAVIMDELQRLGIEENTLVLFTSDNGSRAREGGSNAPLRGRKTETWDGGQRLPLIACWKGQLPAGEVREGLAASIDLLPTFARLSGGALPDKPIDGVDVWDLLVGQARQSPRETFFYFRGQRLEAVRNGRWKLFVSRGGGKVNELYDLQHDIGETSNVFGEHPGVVAELMEYVEAMRGDLGDEVTGAVGKGRRPIGQVAEGRTLTEYDPEHPYIMAEYDLKECG